jgi:hypothetical protein
MPDLSAAVDVDPIRRLAPERFAMKQKLKDLWLKRRTLVVVVTLGLRECGRLRGGTFLHQVPGRCYLSSQAR